MMQLQIPCFVFKTVEIMVTWQPGPDADSGKDSRETARVSGVVVSLVPSVLSASGDKGFVPFRMRFGVPTECAFVTQKQRSGIMAVR